MCQKNIVLNGCSFLLLLFILVCLISLPLLIHTYRWHLQIFSSILIYPLIVARLWVYFWESPAVPGDLLSVSIMCIELSTLTQMSTTKRPPGHLSNILCILGIFIPFFCYIYSQNNSCHLMHYLSIVSVSLTFRTQYLVEKRSSPIPCSVSVT